MSKEFLDLEVPYGLHLHGYLVRADEAERQIQYLCPECKQPLVFRAGEYNVKHFAHNANALCTRESIIHKTAQMLIAQTIRDQADFQKRRPINIQTTCVCCDLDVTRPLPHDMFTDVCIEKYVGDYRCDVVAQRDDKDILAIEILFSHKVGEIKAKNLKIRWVELEAEAVLLNPHYWQPTQYKLKPALCEQCENHINKLNEIIAKFNHEPCSAAIYKDPTKGPYLAEIEICFSCKQEVPVYWWNGVVFCQKNPPEPKPRTINFKYSKSYQGSYWANTCANCNATQGDNFLFLGVDGRKPVFEGLPIQYTEEMKQARSDSMKSVISHMFRNF